MTDILATPLHHKPIVYGSPLANALFLALVVAHILPAIVAPISAIVALATRKGGRVHVGAGKAFVWSMAAVAGTGIAMGLLRMTVHMRENHTKYAGFSMPSTIPARLAFLFVGVVVLWLLRTSVPPAVLRPQPAPPGRRALVVPALLLAFGAALALVIVLWLNPWNGSLWMIGTFSAFVVFATRERMAARTRPDGVARHRAGMVFLAAFSWWGALQGFGPAIAIALRGPDLSTTRYVGDRPGPFAAYFVFFFIGWAPIFALAAYLVRRYRRRAALATAGGR
jgi:hypothetical protein